MSKDILVHVDGKRLSLSASESAEIIERTHAASQWQDISTAPKDGTRILVYGEDVILSCVYGPFFWEAGAPQGTEQLGWIQFDGQLGPDVYPTHWMPLPPAPEAKP